MLTRYITVFHADEIPKKRHLISDAANMTVPPKIGNYCRGNEGVFPDKAESKADSQITKEFSRGF